MTRCWFRLRPQAGNRLLWLLALAAAAFALLRPLAPGDWLRLIDWPTLQALAGLLVLTKGIERSGALQHAAGQLLIHLHTQRSLALALMVLSALLAAFLTNDVSLFLLVPLTVSLASLAQLPLERLVAIEALAVNTGSALTPIGNPQNLFLWQSSNLGFGGFVAMMAAPVALMASLLALTTLLLFPPRPVKLRERAAPARRDPRLLTVSVLLFAGFVAALEFKLALPALLLVLLVFVLFDCRLLTQVDWTLLAIIALMFVDLRQLASAPGVDQWLGRLPIRHGLGTFLAGVACSQLISNVPTAILLRAHVGDLPALAAGVSVGGFGLAISSLANLIALRLAGSRRAPGLLHLIALPFLLLATLAVGLLFV
ncbi:MAG: citrate transporter [Gammaproteobacteria bacterium]|nr:citrate transporter [Gammaproteobacteria bacterium]